MYGLAIVILVPSLHLALAPSHDRKHIQGRRQPTSVGGARQDNVFARNLRARIDNGLYVRTLKDLRNVHEQSRA